MLQIRISSHKIITSLRRQSLVNFLVRIIIIAAYCRLIFPFPHKIGVSVPVPDGGQAGHKPLQFINFFMVLLQPRVNLIRSHPIFRLKLAHLGNNKLEYFRVVLEPGGIVGLVQVRVLECPPLLQQGAVPAQVQRIVLLVQVVQVPDQGCFHHGQPNGESFCLVLVDVALVLALPSRIRLLGRQVCSLVVVDCLDVVGDLAGPREQIAHLDVPLLVDEDILGTDIADFLPQFHKIMGSRDERVEEVPQLGL